MKVMIFVALFVVAAVNCMPRSPATPQEKLLLRVSPDRLPTEEELMQNHNAKYQFSSNVEDHISDLNQQRMEVRDGVNVKGTYSYSDGYYRRTVHYEADDKGYRVVGEEVEPLDLEGPKVDLNGKASIENAAHGTEIKYTVQSVLEEKPQEERVSSGRGQHF